MRCLVPLLVACGGTQGPQEPKPIDNKAAPTTTVEPEQTKCRSVGLVIDATIGEQAIGATLVFSGGGSEQVAISDERGNFSLEIDNGHNRLTVYFGDRTFEWAFQPSYCHTRIRVTLGPQHAPPTPIVPF